MKTIILKTAAIAAIALLPVTAHAQSADTTSTQTAPDGSNAFGIEPYVAVMGGYFSYDRDPSNTNIPPSTDGYRRRGGIVEGIVGANVPLGPVFVGAEGSVAKGFTGDIDWQYGVAGRIGARAGQTGLIYGKVGYEWVNFTNRRGGEGRDYGDMVYGLGAEIGPRDLGMGGGDGRGGVRLRLEATTHDFESIRPMAGVVMHF